VRFFLWGVWGLLRVVGPGWYVGFLSCWWLLIDEFWSAFVGFGFVWVCFWPLQCVFLVFWLGVV